MPVAHGRIHAAGLGLMLFSPPALAAIAARADFMRALEPGGVRYAALVASGLVVLLGTGSPQMDYRVRVHRGGSALDATVLARASFGMRIEDGLAIRDGYAPMDWQIEDLQELRFALPAGLYAVDAQWIRKGADAVDMAIDLVFRDAATLPAGDGWPYLEFTVGREPG
jgi:hypothetical protein